MDFLSLKKEFVEKLENTKNQKVYGREKNFKDELLSIFIEDIKKSSSYYDFFIATKKYSVIINSKFEELNDFNLEEKSIFNEFHRKNLINFSINKLLVDLINSDSNVSLIKETVLKFIKKTKIHNKSNISISNELNKKYNFKSFELGYGFSKSELIELDKSINQIQNYLKKKFNYDLETSEIKIQLSKNILEDWMGAGYDHKNDFIILKDINEFTASILLHEFFHKVQYDTSNYLKQNVFSSSHREINKKFDLLLKAIYSPKEDKLSQLKEYLSEYFNGCYSFQKEMINLFTIKNYKITEKNLEFLREEINDSGNILELFISIVKEFKKKKSNSLLLEIEKQYDKQIAKDKYAIKDNERHSRISEKIMTIDYKQSSYSGLYPTKKQIRKIKPQVESFNKLLLTVYKTLKKDLAPDIKLKM